MVINILAPNLSFDFYQISSLKLSPSSLASKLLARKEEHNEFKTGLLALDSEHRILPLLSFDNSMTQFPLVGIWVANVPSTNTSPQLDIKSPLVWAAAIRFTLQSRDFKEVQSPSSD